MFWIEIKIYKKSKGLLLFLGRLQLRQRNWRRQIYLFAQNQSLYITFAKHRIQDRCHDFLWQLLVFFPPIENFLCSSCLLHQQYIANKIDEPYVRLVFRGEVKCKI